MLDLFFFHSEQRDRGQEGTDTEGKVVFCIYIDSFLFVLGTAIIQFGFGVGYSGSVCETAILLCLVFYVTAKVSSILRGEYSSSREECADGGYLQIVSPPCLVDEAARGYFVLILELVYLHVHGRESCK